jgi:hypothetical protein
MKSSTQYQTIANVYMAVAFFGFLFTSISLALTYYYTDRVVYSIGLAYLVPGITALYAFTYQAKASKAHKQHVNSLTGTPCHA